MQTIIVDLVNVKALRLLEDLERMDLIRIRKHPHQADQISATYYDLKENVLSQSKVETDRQLEALRRDWE